MKEKIINIISYIITAGIVIMFLLGIALIIKGAWELLIL